MTYMPPRDADTWGDDEDDGPDDECEDISMSALWQSHAQGGLIARR